MGEEAIQKILAGILRDLSTPEKEARQKLVDGWKKIVGEALAKRTKPLLAKDDSLIIWTDRSALAFELKQRYKETIVRRVEALLGKKLKAYRVYVGEIRN
ncbi:MAG: DciA family protein [Candidatus Omnitrophota bacterium]